MKRVLTSISFWVVFVVTLPIFLFAFGACSCSSKPSESETRNQPEVRTPEEKPKPVFVVDEEGKFEPVVRIFLSKKLNSDVYIIFVQKGTELERRDIWASDVRLMVDVPDGKPSYVTWKRLRCTNYLEAGEQEFRFRYVELHLQSPKQVRAGTWEEWQRYRAGKYTRSKLVDGPIIEIE